MYDVHQIIVRLLRCTNVIVPQLTFLESLVLFKSFNDEEKLVKCQAVERLRVYPAEFEKPYVDVSFGNTERSFSVTL